MSETKVGLLTAIVGLSSAVIGVVGTIIVGGFGYFNKDRELDIQMVNVGLSILRGEATGNEDTYQARRFALRLLKKYAAVEIPDNEFKDWAETGTTPFRRTYSVPKNPTEEELLALDVDELQRSIEQGIASRAVLLTKLIDRLIKVNCLEADFDHILAVGTDMSHSLEYISAAVGKVKRKNVDVSVMQCVDQINQFQEDLRALSSYEKSYLPK